MNFINRKFILEWNNSFPLDYWWRKKYNVPFNSPRHRETSQIDIYFEWLEENLFEENTKKVLEEAERLQKYKSTGEWIQTYRDEEYEEKVNELFDKMDISAFNQMSDE